MLLGNDDILLQNAILFVKQYLMANPHINIVSRTHRRVEGDQEIGTSRHSLTNRIFSRENAAPRMLFRLCGFFGGLVVNRSWALSIEDARYDGSLYYQIYLAATAYTTDGIGYISAPVVGARADSAPLFGSAAAERDFHIPGSYTPKGRASMWAAVMRICKDVEASSGVPILHDVKSELTVRQSFHVFEMIAQQDRYQTLKLVRELRQLGLMSHPVPYVLATIALIFGRRSRSFFDLCRVTVQGDGRGARVV
jgi:hypothetical protein